MSAPSSAALDTDGEARRAAVRAALGLSGPDDRPDPDRIYHLDPRLLLDGVNVRRDRRPSLGFSASLVQRGVLQPVTCYLADGELVVEMGSRRAHFAAAAGVRSVPVQVLAEPPAPEDRIVDQVVENEHREPLSTAERAAAVEQLVLLKVPIGQIGRRLSMPRGDVDAALAVAGSAAARAAATEHPLTLEQAAAIAEVGDDPDAVAAVVAAATDPATSGGVEHVLQQVRDARRDAADRADAAARLRATGVAVLDERPPPDGPARRLDDLHLRAVEHSACGGHAAYLVQREGIVDGHRGVEWVPEWVCTDPRGYGHGGRQRSLEETARADQRARERAAQEQTDRAWRAAEQVRRRWLRDLAQRQAPPEDAQRWVLECLLRGDIALARAMAPPSRHQLLRDLLGVPHDGAAAGIGELLARTRAASTPRVVLLTVLVLLAAAEEHLAVHTWRDPTEPDRAHLRRLAEWGYPLAPVERALLGDVDGADVSAPGAGG